MTTVSQKILAFNKGLLPEMVKRKYKIMAGNMYSFYRGTCHLFYEDLSKLEMFPKSPNAWICGDLHLENFGSYKGDNRLVYFDLNDFDESILAPASWELARIITSILVAFDSLKISKRKAQHMAQLFLKTYATTLSKGKPYYIERKVARGIVYTFLKAAGNRKKKALLKKRTTEVNNNLSILIDSPKHVEVEPLLKRELMHHMTQWVMYSRDSPYNYEVVDVAFRLAGTGSVGIKRYVFLLKSIGIKDSYMLLEMKQARSSSLQPYVSVPQPEWVSEAERVVNIQIRMQNVAPAFLSHTSFKEESYLIQEMQPEKDSIDFRLIKERYRDICQVIDDMAMLTASAQLRSAGRQGAAIPDEMIAFAQNTEWQHAIMDYAIHYAEKARQNYKRYRADYRKGILQ